MGRKKKPELIIDEQGRAWDPDDFFLDSHGVEAPLRDRLEVLAQGGFKPEEVSEDIREKYRKYLERKKSGSGK
jgi:hypothetical protein